MNVRERLAARNWSDISAWASAYARRRLGKKWHHLADDLARDAIVHVFEHGGWDPENDGKVELAIAGWLKSTCANEVRRHRNAFQDAIDDVEEAFHKATATRDNTEERLDGFRYAAEFHHRLVLRVATTWRSSSSR